MMLCEKCNLNAAKTFSTVIADGKEKELYLCFECAGEHSSPAKFKLFVSKEKNDEKCSCGTKFEEISQSGYVGCSNCYVFFEKQLEPIIAALHTKSYHTGKKKLSKLQIYTAQLEKARQNNFHSLAEKLSAQIKSLREDGK